MKIHDAHDFDARQAAADLVEHGYTAVDDITRGLVGCAEVELLDELGFAAADELDPGIEEMETSSRRPLHVSGASGAVYAK